MLHKRDFVRVLCVALLASFSAGASALSASNLLNSTLATVRSVELVPDQYIVTLHKAPQGHALAGLDVAAQAATLLAGIGGGQILFVYEHALRGFAVKITAAQAQLLAQNPLVKLVEQDSVVRAIATQNNPPSYGLDRVDQRNRPLDGRYTYPDQGGLGVHVYVLDTGLNANHSDFTGRVGVGRNFSPNSGGGLLGGGSTDPNNTTDCQGHGTHVAGTAAGTVYGVAKRATIHPVRVLDCRGSGTNAAVIGGIDWVTANHTKPAIANMSLGGGNNTSLDAAVRNSIAAGVTYVVAAGNDSADACTGSPNRVTEAITVGSTTSSDAMSSFSNRGSCVDIFAPGSSIISASHSNNTGTTTLSGTSMAAPHVAGAGALVLGRTPGASPNTVWATLDADSTKGVLTSIGTGSPNKLLYVANAGGGTPVDNPPVASFAFTCNNLACAFDGSGSSDDNGIASYSWNFGDGSGGNGVTPTRTYAAAGSYSVTLTVTDGIGQTGTQTRTVSVSSGGSTAPCSNCTKYTGTLANGAQVYHPGTGGFSYTGGTLKGYLRGPASGADFDLYLERLTSGLLGSSWSIVARAETNSSSENISYNAASGTYRWRVRSYSGSGSYEFYGEPR